MKRNLRGLRLLITGASSGIGRSLAEQAAAEGARLALVARSEDRLAELVETLTARGADAVAIPADVTSPADQAHVLERVVDRFDGLDVLVNNAGVGSWGHFTGSSEAILRQVMEVNFFAAAELTRLFLPTLTRGRQPALVNVASMCGRRGMPAWPEYSASKFALCGLTESLRGEMARFDLDVLLVIPGLTRTGLSNAMLRNEGRAKIDFSAGMPPERVARRTLQALRNNWTETTVGGDARWMLRANRLFPRLVDWLIGRRVARLYA